MPPNVSLRARNSATATSFAALSAVGAAPPASRARLATRRAGNRVGSGSSKVKVAVFARSSRGAGPASRPGQAIGNRYAHVRTPELRNHRAVAVLDQAVHNRLGMDQDIDLLRTKRKEM